MKSARIRSLALASAVVVGLVVSANAKIIAISFGGVLGNEYSPNSTSIELGDTVQWDGSFSAHPLSSIAIPSGEQSFHQQTGSVFKYVPKSLGQYEYHCDLHYGMDMIGMGMYGFFTVKAPTARISSQPRTASQPQLRLSGITLEPHGNLSFSVFAPQTASVRMSIVRFDGSTAAILTNSESYSGMRTFRSRGAKLPSGRYAYTLLQGTSCSTGMFNIAR